MSAQPVGPWEITPNGTEILRQQVQLPRHPHHVGTPSTYGQAWLNISKAPPELTSSGDAATDHALRLCYSNYFDVKEEIGVLNERQKTLNELRSQADPMAEKLYALAEEHKTAHHDVKMRSRALKRTQDAAVQAVGESTSESSERERLVQQHVVALSSKLLFESGQYYVELTIQWKKMKPAYDKLMEQVRALREKQRIDECTLQEVIIPQFVFKTDRIEAIFVAMQEDKGLDASEWVLNERVGAIVGAIEANLGRDLESLRRGIGERLRQEAEAAAPARPR